MTQCKIKKCNTEVYARNVCWKHYYQLRTHGRILERTIYDANEIIKYDDYAEILLYDRGGNEIGRTKIDLDDVEKCSKYKWRLHNAGYAHGRLIGSSTSILLHRLIMNPSKGEWVDHKFHDTLDNRKCNLRVCTPQQNHFNRTFKSNSISGIKGILWDKQNLKWQVKIGLDGKTIHLGRFKDIKDAIKIRIEKELELFGEYVDKKGINEVCKKYKIK